MRFVANAIVGWVWMLWIEGCASVGVHFEGNDKLIVGGMHIPEGELRNILFEFSRVGLLRQRTHK